MSLSDIQRRLAAATGTGPKLASDKAWLISLKQKVYDIVAETEITIRVSTQPTWDSSALWEGRLIAPEEAVGSSAYSNGEIQSIAPLKVGRFLIANSDGALTKYLDPKLYSWSGRQGVVKIGAVDIPQSSWALIPESTLVLAQEPTVEPDGNLSLVYLPPADRLNRLAQPNTYGGFGYGYQFHHAEADENWINHGSAWNFGNLDWAFQFVMRVSPKQAAQGPRVLMMNRDALNSGPGYSWIGQSTGDGQRFQVEDDNGNEIQGFFDPSYSDSTLRTFTVVMDRTNTEMRLYVNDEKTSTVDASSLTGNVTTIDGVEAVLGWRFSAVSDDRCDFFVAETRVWHKALTDSEVAENWAATMPPQTPFLEALYRYNVNQGTKSYDERGGPRSRWLTLLGGYVEATSPEAGRPNPDDGSISATLQLAGRNSPSTDQHLWGKMDYTGSTPIDGWAIIWNSATQTVDVVVANSGTTAKVAIPGVQFAPGKMTGVAFRYEPDGDGFLVVWVQRGRDAEVELVNTGNGTHHCAKATTPLRIADAGAIYEPNGSTAGGGGNVVWQIHGAATHHEANALNPETWSYVEVPHDNDPVLTLDFPAVTPPGGGADYQVIFAYHAPLGGSGLDVTFELISGAIPQVVATWARTSVGSELVVESQDVPQASVPDPNTLSIRATWTQGTAPIGDPASSIYPLAVFVPDSTLSFNGVVASVEPWYRRETDDSSLEIGDMLGHGPRIDRDSWLSPHWSPTGVSAGNIFEASITLGDEPISHEFTRLVVWAGRRLHDKLAATVSQLTVRFESDTLTISRELYMTEDGNYGFRLSAAESALLAWDGGVALVRITDTPVFGATEDSHPVVYEIWMEADFGESEVSPGYEARNVSAAIVGGSESELDVSTATATPSVLSLTQIQGMLDYYLVPPDDYPDLPIDPIDPVAKWLEVANSILEQGVNPLLWRLDEGTGSTVYDSGPGRYDGTIYGAHRWGGLDGDIATHQAAGSTKYDDLLASDNGYENQVVTQGEWLPTYEGDPRLVGTMKPVVAGSAMGVPLVHVGGGQWQVSDPDLGTILKIRRIYANGLPVPSWQWSLVPDENVAWLGPEFDGYDVTADVYGITDTTGVDGPTRFLWRTDLIAERLLGAKGAGLELDSTALEAYAAHVPYRMGLAYGLGRKWTLEQLMEFLAGPHGWWSQNSAGEWRLTAFRSVADDAVTLHLSADAIGRATILPTKDPVSVLRLGVRRQWKVIRNFLGAVSEPDRDRQSQEWRHATYPNEAIRKQISAIHMRAREWPPTSPISGEADGAVESDRLGKVVGVGRRFLRLRLVKHYLELDHGDVVTIDWPKLDYDASDGKWLVVGSTFGSMRSQPAWSVTIYGPFLPDEWYEAQ